MVAPVGAGAALGDLDSCLLMGTVVRHGEATAVVVAIQFAYQAKRAQIDPLVIFWITLANYGLPDLVVGATMTYDVRWTGADTGAQTMTTSSSVPVHIGEIQVVATN